VILGHIQDLSLILMQKALLIIIAMSFAIRGEGHLFFIALPKLKNMALMDILPIKMGT